MNGVASVHCDFNFNLKWISELESMTCYTKNGSTQGNSNSTMDVEPRFGILEADMLNQKPNSLVKEKTHAHDTGPAQK